MPYPPDHDEPVEIPPCDWPPGHPRPEWPRGYYDFIALFNAWEFFDCHHVLEDVWLDTTTAERNFYQGLIHVATALHHVTRENMKGARLLFISGHDLLAPYEDGFMDFPLADFLAMCDRWFPLIDAAWREGRVAEIDAAPIPPIRLRPAG